MVQISFLNLCLGAALLTLSTNFILHPTASSRETSAVMFTPLEVASNESIDDESHNRGSFRKHSSDIIVSLHDETSKSNYFIEDKVNIIRTDEGKNIHIHINIISNDTKAEGTRKEEKDHQKQEQLCPSIIRNKIGLFDKEKSNSSLKDDFDDTVLLVASNYAYYNMLQNWEFLANKLDLQWAVLALDDKLYEELGPSRAIPPEENFAVSGAHSWGKGNFKELSCNKVRMALQIANSCNVNVVFTDADNIFFQNPFEHDLGRLIKSKRYDYLYQPNHPASNPREDQCLQGIPRDEANTGFYYFNHKSKTYKAIVEKTLERCQDPGNKLDDQSTFWQEFWNIKQSITGVGKSTRTRKRSKGRRRRRRSNDDDSGIDFHHCGLSEYENPALDRANESAAKHYDTFSYCCMDPYYYPTGDHDSKQGPSNNDPITYHGNYAKNYGVRVEKLLNARPDQHGWDPSRFKDGIGGLVGYRDFSAANYIPLLGAFPTLGYSEFPAIQCAHFHHTVRV
mmetsp:Transcript_26531/g.58114  ORF Transcript_26531/g.58114 Transcript_26531/m.58114 type:complete len:509 (-) Transcript_26531:1514-3040(-)